MPHRIVQIEGLTLADDGEREVSYEAACDLLQVFRTNGVEQAGTIVVRLGIDGSFDGVYAALLHDTGDVAALVTAADALSRVADALRELYGDRGQRQARCLNLLEAAGRCVREDGHEGAHLAAADEVEAS